MFEVNNNRFEGHDGFRMTTCDIIPQDAHKEMCVIADEAWAESIEVMDKDEDYVASWN
jgi:hypothetical protein